MHTASGSLCKKLLDCSDTCVDVRHSCSTSRHILTVRRLACGMCSCTPEMNHKTRRVGCLHTQLAPLTHVTGTPQLVNPLKRYEHCCQNTQDTRIGIHVFCTQHSRSSPAAEHPLNQTGMVRITNPQDTCNQQDVFSVFVHLHSFSLGQLNLYTRHSSFSHSCSSTHTKKGRPGRHVDRPA
jgi:hypothetical protein